ncbi:MAG: hypothetical protein ACERLB_07090 [Gammaproteobacteria bacterium]
MIYIGDQGSVEKWFGDVFIGARLESDVMFLFQAHSGSIRF